MMDKMMSWQQLEKSINNLNNYTHVEKSNKEYIDLHDSLISGIEEAIHYIGIESVKSLVGNLMIKHQEYACKRAFFNLNNDQFHNIYNVFNQTVINKLLEFLVVKKNISVEHLTSKFGEHALSENEILFKSIIDKNITSKQAPYGSDYFYNDQENVKIINELNVKLSYSQADNARLKKELSSLKKSLSTLENEKTNIELQLNNKFDEEVRSTLGRFVNKAMSELKIKEKKYTIISLYWILGGSIACLGIVASIISIMVWMSNIVDVTKSISWSLLIYYVGKGAVILSALSTLAYYCFKQSNSYVHESLKQGERVHAIRFGQLCLRLYGKQINENQIKNVFADWNINSSTAFSNIPKDNDVLSDIPKNISELFKATIETISKK